MKKRINMRLLTVITVVLLLLSVVPISAQLDTTVTLLHFSDYHSHAVPFYSEGEHSVAGVARVIAYLTPYADDVYDMTGA